jgi:hypothetical protein
MDTPELTTALREATEGLEPRHGFADAVVAGGRRRRNRNRITLVAALACTAAVVAGVAVTGPNPLTAPPPSGDSIDSPVARDDWRLRHFAGEHIDDSLRNSEILETWTTGLRGGRSGPANWNGAYDERPGDPHVYWSGETPYGDAAIVVERLGRERDGLLLTGIVAAAPHSPQPRLLGVQQDDEAGHMGFFMLPDDRTVVAVEQPGQGLWVSPEIRYDDESSHREWTPVPVRDGVGVVQLPEGTNPLNVRLVSGAPDTPPRRADMEVGAHLPLLVTSVFPSPAPPQPAQRGLGWTGAANAGDLADIQLPDNPLSPGDHFERALRDSGLLDPSSYQERGSWHLVAALTDGRMVVVSEEQELDHPAYLYAVVIDRDGRPAAVDRLGEATPGTTLPVVYRLPGTHGWLVGAFGEDLSYRTSTTASWSDPVRSADILPTDAIQVRVGDQVVDLPQP